MIIGYYPGAGGNRYYQFLKNREFSTLGQAYDGLTDQFAIKSRGLYLDKIFKNNITGDILCHSVNYQRIVEAFGTQTIYIINSDLKASLRREWSIKGKYRPMFQNNKDSYEKFILELYYAIKDMFWPSISTLDEFYKLPDCIKEEVNQQIALNICHLQNNNVYNFLNAAFTAIVWHKKIYDDFPLDVGQGILVDINNQNTKFTRLMNQELSLYQNNILFNFAWDVHTKHGNHAPIIDLYREFINEQR